MQHIDSSELKNGVCCAVAIDPTKKSLGFFRGVQDMLPLSVAVIPWGDIGWLSGD